MLPAVVRCPRASGTIPWCYSTCLTVCTNSSMGCHNQVAAVSLVSLGDCYPALAWQAQSQVLTPRSSRSRSSGHDQELGQVSRGTAKARDGIRP